MAAITKDGAERFVRAGVPAGKPHATLRDGTGLCLRLLPTGTATWHFVYRVSGLGRQGTQKTLRIGPWPDVEVSKAKMGANALAGKVARGGDPRAEIKEQKRRERAVLSAALDDYEKWIESRRLLKSRDMMSALRRGLQHLRQRDLAEIDRKTLIDAIERIEKDGRPGAARDFRKRLRAFLNRQLALGSIVIDPLAGFRLPAATKNDVIKAEEHGKALSDDEILSTWRAASALGGSFGALVKMGLLTGLRRSELAALRWDWIDREALKITLPGKAMKNGREHTIPVTATIAGLLDATPNRGGGLVFPSERRHGGTTPLSGWSQFVTRLRKASGVEGVGLHDLRRTYRSALADLGIREEIAEAMIAHRRSDLVSRYNRSELLEQRRAAAEAFDGWISALISREDGQGSRNVVSLASAKKLAG